MIPEREPAGWPMILGRGGMGKLPTQSDFVRGGPNLPELALFDRWIEEGMSIVERELGADWAGLYDQRLNYRFTFRPQEGRHTLVGTLRAAMDRHTRRYPFVTHAIVASAQLDQQPTFLPSVADALFGDLERLVQEVAGLGTVAEIQRNLGVVPRATYQPSASMEGRYNTFLEEVACGEMVGPGGEPGELLLKNLVAVLASRSVTPDALPVALGLPLNQPPSARPLEVRFWLELVLILLHWYPPRLSWFWEMPADAAGQGTLILSTRQPSAQLWLGLLGGVTSHQRVWRPWLDQPFAAAAQSFRIHVDLHPQHSLRQLLDFLCPGYPAVCPWSHGGEPR